MSEYTAVKRLTRKLDHYGVRTKGVPEKPEGFLGKRRHNGALSFSARKTMSEVCADEVAVC